MSWHFLSLIIMLGNTSVCRKHDFLLTVTSCSWYTCALVYMYTHIYRTRETDEEIWVKLTLELPASLVSLALNQKCLGYKFDLLLINEVSLGVSGES